MDALLFNFPGRVVHGFSRAAKMNPTKGALAPEAECIEGRERAGFSEPSDLLHHRRYLESPDLFPPCPVGPNFCLTLCSTIGPQNTYCTNSW